MSRAFSAATLEMSRRTRLSSSAFSALERMATSAFFSAAVAAFSVACRNTSKFTASSSSVSSAFASDCSRASSVRASRATSSLELARPICASSISRFFATRSTSDSRSPRRSRDMAAAREDCSLRTASRRLRSEGRQEGSMAATSLRVRAMVEEKSMRSHTGLCALEARSCAVRGCSRGRGEWALLGGAGGRA